MALGTLPGLMTAGMGLAKYFTRGPKVTSEQLMPYLPSYGRSKYDKPAGEQLFGELGARARGERVGYAPGDIATMEAQAIDESGRAANEMIRRGMAGRTATGGVTTGGTNVLREKALLGGLGLKSQALRDVALRNAILKRQEQAAGISGFQGFLESERAEQARRFAGEMQRSGAMSGAAQGALGYNMARRGAGIEGLMQAGMGIGGMLGGMFGAGGAKQSPVGSVATAMGKPVFMGQTAAYDPNTGQLTPNYPSSPYGSYGYGGYGEEDPYSLYGGYGSGGYFGRR